MYIFYYHSFILKTKDDFLIICRDLGVASTAIDNRPTFDGYIYNENEYCAEPVYNNATTLQEAVDKCNNDPQCAAIEDRWGSGKAPIALCKKYRGKRAGAGTYLLLRGN